MLGRRPVPQLVARGHQVTATTTSKDGLALLERLGARAVVMDGLDAASAGEAVPAARPDAIVHQMSAIAPVHAGKPDIKHFDKWFALTVRLPSEGTDHLLAAAQPAGPTSSRRATPAGTAPARAAGSRPRRTPWTRTRAAGRKADGGGSLPRQGRRHRGRRRPAVRRAVRPGGDRRPGRASPKAAVPLIGDGGGYSSWIHLDWAESASRRRSRECAARRHARRPRRRPHRRHGSPSRASRPTPPRPVRRGDRGGSWTPFAAVPERPGRDQGAGVRPPEPGRRARPCCGDGRRGS